MSDFKKTVTTPVCRIVAGGPGMFRTKDFDNNPLVYKSGDMEGQPRRDYYMRVALDKKNPGTSKFMKDLEAYAKDAYPAHRNLPLENLRKVLALKIYDGDTDTDDKGNPLSSREGYKGCWVLKMNSGIPPKCFTRGGQSAIDDSTQVKTGYFVRVRITLRPNGSKASPGIFVNHDMVEMYAYGSEINFGPSAEDVFSEDPAYLPEGASLSGPVATETETQEGAPPPPPPEFDDTYTYQGNTYTYEQLKKFGWTEQQIERCKDDLPF